MRLWHYKLIKYLPDTQLLAQWRELNSIYKHQTQHLLINYVYDYPKENLYNYSLMVIAEMDKRKMKIYSWDNFNNYFSLDPQHNIKVDSIKLGENPFPSHHTRRYLRQCFYNLQEKYERGQKDFTNDTYYQLLDIATEL